jgi:NAD kinase
VLMAGIYEQLFLDESLIKKIKDKLPKLFLLAEADNSRSGKLGMQVGSTREQILIALLMYKFGEKNVNADIPITESEIDAFVYDEPLSIKTVTGSKISGFKLIWTVDANSADVFAERYQPTCDILLTQINWGGIGHLILFRKDDQAKILNELTSKNYLKLPKPGTNSRGVEISSLAVNELLRNENTKKIDINFIREQQNYNAYKRWLDLWHAI